LQLCEKILESGRSRFHILCLIIADGEERTLGEEGYLTKDARLFFKECHRSTHPVFVFIVPGPDHFSLAEPGKIVDGKRTWPALLPKIEQPDLCFGRLSGRLDHVSIFYFF
jgi:hypothetical protein